jgi:hypothetical protein
MRSLVGIILAGWLSAASAQPAPPLGSAASFAVLAGSSVTADKTHVGGNVGVSPGDRISGEIVFTVGGKFRNDVAARTAQRDSLAAYRQLDALECTSFPGGRPPPGLYCVGPSLSGTLVLDGDGVWIFQARGDFATGPGTNVLLINGASRDKVFWQVPGSATLGENTAFAGNILAVGGIDVGPGARLSGRALAQKGAVTLNGRMVSMCCPLITLSPQTKKLPDATVGKAYDQPIAPAAVLTSGSLPDGLTPSISGTPTKAGHYEFTLTAIDGEGCSGTAEYEIDVVAPPCETITVRPESLTPIIEGCEFRYNEKLSASCGTPPHTFSGQMPEGMTLLPDGTIFGTPLTCTHFEVIATDALGISGKKTYDVCGWPITILPATLPDAFASATYDVHLTASGEAPHLFSVCAGKLPDDLRLSPAGRISGKAVEPGGAKFTVLALDARGLRGSRNYELRILPCPMITVLPAVIPDGAVDKEYDVTFMATGGAAPYVFTAQPLPSGLDLDPATGRLTGVPKTGGMLTFTVTATDVHGCSGSRTYTPFICNIAITPETLPPATACTPYSEQFFAGGGIGPYVFSSTGRLPGGMSPVTSEGVLAGTPAEGGDFTIVVTASDAKCTGSRTYAFHVNGSAGSSIGGGASTLPSGTLGFPYNQPLPFTGGTAPLKARVVTGSGTSAPPGLNVTVVGLQVRLVGTPTQSGSYRFNVDITSAGECVPHRITYTIAIFPIP